ncbi:MAG: DUF4856 domain-containing protein [Chryseolinea sp.]
MTRRVNDVKMFVCLIALGVFGCDDENGRPSLRTPIDYNTITPSSKYPEAFVDVSGVSTVDLTEGNQRYKMFQALNYYQSSSIAANNQIETIKLKNLFSNTGNPFSDISTSTISVLGAELNSSAVQLKDVVASSKAAPEAEAVRAKFETWFNEISAASASLTTTATAGQAGKLGSYLVDARGIETIQVIQKGMIGALQLDYIGNILLDEGLTADNYKVSDDKNYTELEHNWDVAYGLLTLNPIYLEGATDASRNSVEFGAGAYIWEYNKTGYPKIHPAFLKGRAAIVNNDRSELETQATLIRTEFEKAIANAAIGYLEKWKNAVANGSNSADAVRAHAIGEGIGFIYSLRFATIHDADATFSDNILSGLVGSTNGFWDLDVAKINTASQTIKTKFSL